MKESKNIVIGLLCAVICVMAVAYAAFATTLTVNGTASIESEWGVEITDIQCEATAASGGEELDEVTKSFEATTAHFEFKFKQPGDTGTCTVTVKNTGNLEAKVESINSTAQDGEDGSIGLEEGAIKYEVSGISNGELLGGSNTTTLTVKATFQDTETMPEEKNLTKKLTVTINYVQNLAAKD